MIPQTETPPADPTAVIGRRILAYIIDGVILIALLVALFASMASSEDQGSTFQAELTCDLINNNSNADYVCIAADSTVILISNGDLGLLALIAGLYGLVTHMLLPAATGFSPGKAMVGLRIVNQESFERAGIGANFLRWVLWIVDSAPWCFPLVGLITGLSSSGHRRVGDMAAKTLVIDKKWVGRPLAVPGVNSVAALTPPPPAAAPPFGSPPPPAASPVGVSAPPPPQPQGFPAAPPVAAATPPPPPTPPPPTPPRPTAPPPSTTAPPPPTPNVTPAPPSTPPAPIAPPATPPPEMPLPETPPPATPPPDATVDFEPDPPAAAEPTTPEPPAPSPPEPPAPPEPPEPEPAPSRPGIDAPQWDPDRDTYIQWDPELSEWMEWNEASGAWIPISR